jgi:hypothetical protein
MDPAAAAMELLRRRKARECLLEFSQQIVIPGAPVSDDPDEWQFKAIETRVAAHHRLLMETLQRISETPGGRAMVFMPFGEVDIHLCGVPGLGDGQEARNADHSW